MCTLNWMSLDLTWVCSKQYQLIKGISLQYLCRQGVPGSHQNYINSSRYLLRSTSVQSFNRCWSEGGLPCNTKWHIYSAESILGLEKRAPLVMECAYNCTGSSQRTTLPSLITHIAEPSPSTQAGNHSSHISGQKFLFFKRVCSEMVRKRHSLVSQDVLVGLVGLATHPGQGIPWDPQNPSGPCPLSFLQPPWGQCHLLLLSEDAWEQ